MVISDPVRIVGSTMSTNRNTVIIVDNVDLDNPLAAIAGCHPSLGLNVKAVIVTGRLAYARKVKDTTSFSPRFSHEVLLRNTRRMKGILTRAGYGDRRVFSGLVPPRTLVKHDVHVDERLLDLRQDELHVREDGDFEAAIRFLRRFKSPIDLIVGGPMTEVAALIGDSRLVGRFGRLTCQLGMFGFGNVRTMAGGQLSFNSACDPKAASWVVENFPGEIYLVPTDVTKGDAVGFDIGQLPDMGISEELEAMYRIFWEQALKPRGERIYPHDVHPVFLMHQLRTGGSMYDVREVAFTQVSPEGVIGVDFNGRMVLNPKHFLATSVDAVAFKRSLRRVARGHPKAS
jgi:inosine-uridine nucleoside N-ribohydrolase